ncbi:helix-turn-helix transcriptional regulator [Tamlana sp. 2_MG-2023]|uniref:helix-turn-helix domain-containing protein n=1 Tax=unclassified Tamlana TaxID=2614803 RepID=UPI0026E2270E|nr:MULTISPECIES: helix-turn-helix transcriptional regulator [unclassified Tamlana]MDO6761065.1 helix-turn-helix transcriptional regulator [Tamlana sp. 2_MG-2023]MDO6791602.1 helix-turn-helix transcriptional regulator [Tamlana sp. 1_MG-2023]
MINKFLLKEFGLKIRDLRLKNNLSQEKLSFITGFHRTYIGMIERGERNISLTNIAVFSKAFEMDISDLLNFKNQNPKLSYQDYKFKSDS